MTLVKVQTILVDRSASGRKRKWKEFKEMNEYLSVAYEDVDERKAERLKTCALKLSFAVKSNGEKKLVGAWFCRVRLCPVCTWRRSLKVAAQMHQILYAIGKDKKQAYIFLTLTQKNVTGDQLSDEITKVIHGFNSLTREPKLKSAVNGYYRSIEVTHNVDPNSPSYDTYHTHIHALLAVDPNYFLGKKYIKHDEWIALWKKVMKLDYDPSVHVQRIKGNTAKAISEVAKYAVKPEDYILPLDWDLTVDTVRILDAALHNRRFISFGGIFKEYHRKLHLDNENTGDLIHIDDDPLKPETVNDEHRVHFLWFSGYRQYYEGE